MKEIRAFLGLIFSLSVFLWTHSCHGMVRSSDLARNEKEGEKVIIIAFLLKLERILGDAMKKGVRDGSVTRTGGLVSFRIKECWDDLPQGIFSHEDLKKEVGTILAKNGWEVSVLRRGYTHATIEIVPNGK